MNAEFEIIKILKQLESEKRNLPQLKLLLLNLPECPIKYYYKARLSLLEVRNQDSNTAIGTLFTEYKEKLESANENLKKAKEGQFSIYYQPQQIYVCALIQTEYPNGASFEDAGTHIKFEENKQRAQQILVKQESYLPAKVLSHELGDEQDVMKNFIFYHQLDTQYYHTGEAGILYLKQLSPQVANEKNSLSYEEQKLNDFFEQDKRGEIAFENFLEAIKNNHVNAISYAQRLLLEMDVFKKAAKDDHIRSHQKKAAKKLADYCDKIAKLLIEKKVVTQEFQIDKVGLAYLEHLKIGSDKKFIFPFGYDAEVAKNYLSLAIRCENKEAIERIKEKVGNLKSSEVNPKTHLELYALLKVIEKAFEKIATAQPKTFFEPVENFQYLSEQKIEELTDAMKAEQLAMSIFYKAREKCFQNTIYFTFLMQLKSMRNYKQYGDFIDVLIDWKEATTTLPQGIKFYQISTEDGVLAQLKSLRSEIFSVVAQKKNTLIGLNETEAQSYQKILKQKDHLDKNDMVGYQVLALFEKQVEKIKTGKSNLSFQSLCEFYSKLRETYIQSKEIDLLCMSFDNAVMICQLDLPKEGKNNNNSLKFQ